MRHASCNLQGKLSCMSSAQSQTGWMHPIKLNFLHSSQHACNIIWSRQAGKVRYPLTRANSHMRKHLSAGSIPRSAALTGHNVSVLYYIFAEERDPPAVCVYKEALACLLMPCYAVLRTGHNPSYQFIETTMAQIQPIKVWVTCTSLHSLPSNE